jgi:hypothetical protein
MNDAPRLSTAVPHRGHKYRMMVSINSRASGMMLTLIPAQERARVNMH